MQFVKYFCKVNNVKMDSLDYYYYSLLRNLELIRNIPKQGAVFRNYSANVFDCLFKLHLWSKANRISRGQAITYT